VHNEETKFRAVKSRMLHTDYVPPDANFRIASLEEFHYSALIAIEENFDCDLGVQFMAVSIRPDADSLPGFKYYHTLERTVPRDL
jgi:hypothetical protein